MDNNLEMTIMNLVVDSGNCRSYAMEAISLAREGKFDEAEESIKQAEEEILKAHHSQTDLIQKEAAGEKTDISLLLIHSQDHLMTAIVVKDLAKEFIALYRMIK